MLGDLFSQGVAQLNLFDENAPRGQQRGADVTDGQTQPAGPGNALFCGAGYGAGVADEARDAVAVLYDAAR